MSELIKIEALEPEKIFKDEGVQPLIDEVKNQVKDFEADVSTEKGRKEIASAAYKVTRSKTAVDNLGKEYVAHIKNIAKVIDQQRKYFREEMEEIKSEIRAPLDKYEKQIEDRDKAVKFFEESGVFNFDPQKSDIQERLTSIDEFIKTISADENPYIEDINNAYYNASLELKQRLEKAEQQEKERQELEVLREKEKTRQAEQAREEIEKQAAEKERQKIEQENQRREAEQKKREADIEHKRQIHNAILSEMQKHLGSSVEDDVLKNLISIIAQNKINNIKILY